jgi:hypothetical protein
MPFAFHSHAKLVEHLMNTGLHHADAGQWTADWKERWVVFADLIAFASRSRRSRQVVLNNIVRFDRASSLAKSIVPAARIFRFSDSTFAVLENFEQAVAFSVALQHCCLAMNARVLANRSLFIHKIVPKVTIAFGEVLALPEAAAPNPRYDGLDPRALIAGDGIVKAYALEGRTSGGMITISAADAARATKIKVRGDATRTRVAIEHYIGACALGAGSSPFFARGDVFDIPWLLLRPSQSAPGELWAASKRFADEAIAEFLDVWELSMKEFHSPSAASDALDVSKHFSAGLRHATRCAQAIRGRRAPSYLSLEELKAALARR